jgi:ABC-type nickel/cobalt efflux system permease component RcnA
MMRSECCAMRSVLLWLAAAFLMGFLSALNPARAGAHPMGNFSISHYTAIRLEPNHIELLYLLDMAEIPTFQELQESKILPDAKHPSARGYLAKKAESLKRNLRLEINGRRLGLRSEPKEIIFPPGAGNLPTLKLMVVYRADLEQRTSGNYQLYFEDRNYPDRAGWKEIIIRPSSGVSLLSTSAPEQDRSAQLSDYPTDLLNSPPQDSEARIAFEVSGVAPSLAKEQASPTLARARTPSLPAAKQQTRNADVKTIEEAAISSEQPQVLLQAPKDNLQPVLATNSSQLRANKQATPRSAFTEMMARKQLGLGIILVALAVAAGLGAFHALEPGHGKTLVAAYLVGTRGTMKHAMLLGLIVTAAHTAGVYLLGGVTLYASSYIVPEQLYPWLAVISGVMITTLGLILLLRRYFGKEGSPSHHHEHVHERGHDHGHHHHHHGRHEHEHDHDHSHHDGEREVPLKELLALGVSGGIVPCPAALVVLLSAVSMQRVGFGLLLIVAFSVGLAAVLIIIGLLMVYARQFMAGFQADSRLVTRWLPLASSAFIILFGIALTVQALRTAGLLQIQL